MKVILMGGTKDREVYEINDDLPFLKFSKLSKSVKHRYSFFGNHPLPNIEIETYTYFPLEPNISSVKIFVSTDKQWKIEDVLLNLINKYPKKKRKNI